jgi:hypothetical protein
LSATTGIYYDSQSGQTIVIDDSARVHLLLGNGNARFASILEARPTSVQVGDEQGLAELSKVKKSFRGAPPVVIAQPLALGDDNEATAGIFQAFRAAGGHMVVVDVVCRCFVRRNNFYA